MSVSDTDFESYQAPPGRRGRPGAGRTARYGASAEVPTPNLQECGQKPFTGQDLQNLIAQLRAPTWPRAAPNIFGLEGLLTALLVLPLGLRPGAWLPLVWNETGWRVPPMLQDERRFQGFIDLVVGFMRSIDSGLLDTPARFATLLEHPGLAPDVAQQPVALADWVGGFGLVLKQVETSKVRFDPVTQRLLFAIAMHANPAAARICRGHKPPPLLQDAIVTLAAIRTSRGPLGALPTPAPETKHVKRRP